MSKIIQNLSHFVPAPLKKLTQKYKKTSWAVGVLVLLGLAYTAYGYFGTSSTETRYVLAVVEKGTLVASIGGSGQVSASNQVDLKPKVSGDVLYIGVTPGQEVKAGALIAQLDTVSAQKAVRDAQQNLESAKLSLEKLTQAADTLSTIQAENALASAQTTYDKSYDDGFNAVSSAYLDLPGVMTTLNNLLYPSSTTESRNSLPAIADTIQYYDANASLFKSDAEDKYQAARTKFDTAFAAYRGVTRFADHTTIEKLVTDTYDTTKAISEAVKSLNDLLNFEKDNLTKRNQPIPSTFSGYDTSLSTATTGVNSHLNDLLTAKNSITSGKYGLAEKTESLNKLKSGADPLDVRSSQLTVTQRENALRDAQAELANYYIRAPFDGTVAKVSVKKGDSASSGAAVATVITKQKIAEISLNEVDASRVKVGQKATLTFDAIDGLTIAGSVQEVDTLGTVTQGVVAYTVKIGFETQDDRIKSGMTANSNIQTDVHQDILFVPSSAVKTQNGASVVQVFTPPLSDTGGTTGVTASNPPQPVEVTLGISNDTQVEIVSGLSEGEQIVTRTISGTAATATTRTTTTTTGGATRGGQGAIRF